jgi:hypothetical protein
MKDFILIFVLSVLLWAWLNLHAQSIRQQKIMEKETRKILLKRFKDKIGTEEKQEQADIATKRIDGGEKSTDRFNMNAYPYLQQERRCGKERRKSRVKVGIVFEYNDRRKADITSYIDPEKRIGIDRRGKDWDRRKPKIPLRVLPI